MAKFFGGMGGGGAGSRFNKPKQGMEAGGSLERALAAKKGMESKKLGQMSAEERYQKLISDKMEAQKSRLMQAKKFSHQIPGVAPMEKEMSKSTQAALELMAQKMAKREMRKKEKPKDLVISPTPIGGMYPGYIDAKGRVWGAGNKQVLQIDLKTGYIKTLGFFGRKVGKFDPKSNFCFHKIQKHLEKHAIKSGYAPETSVWGAKEKPADPSSIYGSNGWGGGNNNNNGGTGWW